MSQTNVYTEPPPKPADIPLRVYSNPICPFAQRVRLIVAAKGIRAEEINIHLQLKLKPEWYLAKVNSHGKVPVIEHDGHIIRESLVAFDYIDEVFGDKSLWPTKPHEKAAAKLLVNDFGNEFTPNFYKIANDQANEAQVAQLTNYLEKLETILKENGGSGFLQGDIDNPGAVDLLVWPWFERLVAKRETSPALGNLFTKERFPHLHSWIAHMLDNDAVKQSYLPPEAYHAFSKTLKETGKADLGVLGKEITLYSKNDDDTLTEANIAELAKKL